MEGFELDGVAHNLPNSLRLAFSNPACFDHHSVFDGNRMIHETRTEIQPQLEYDEIQRNEYLKKYLDRLV